MHRPSIRILCFVGAASMVDGCGYAQAQTAGTSATGESDHGLEEIIVTARKRQEGLINVPVAVSAVGKVELERAGATDLNRIGQLTPQVSLAKADSGAGASFTIRGIGSSALDNGIEQSVAINIDGVQLTRGNFISQGIFDLQQVEVLKGPQALFFGKNSPAGVVSLHSQGPSDHLEGYVRTGYEFVADEYFGEAAISGPISDTLKARLAVRGSSMKGWLVNNGAPLPNNPFYSGVGTPGPDKRRDPGTEEVVGRLTVVFQPSSDFDATLKLSGGITKDNGPGATTQPFCSPSTLNPSVTLPFPGTPRFTDPFIDCKFDKIRTSTGMSPVLTANWPGQHADGKTFARNESILTSLIANYNLNDITITSVTGYYNINFKGAQNYDYTSYGALGVSLGEKSHAFSEELRVVSAFDAPVNFTLGGYYESMGRSNYDNVLLVFVGPDPATGKFESYDRPGKDSGTTISAFGQLRWDVTNTVQLAGGVRYTHETRKTFLKNAYIHPFFLPGAPGGGLLATAPLTNHRNESNWSPEINLSWRPVKDMMFYVSYKTGYKSGGYSSPSLVTANFNSNTILFEPETVKGVEGGYKAELFNRTLRVELSAYRYDYKDLQLALFKPDIFSFVIANAANARVQGVELSGEWRATKELRLRGDVGYNQARYTDFPNAPCFASQTVGPAKGQCNISDPFNPIQDLAGRPLARAPDWTFNFGASYDVALGSSGLKLGLNGDVKYTGSYYLEEDEAPDAHQSAFALFNAGIRIYPESDHWELALIGRNLANKYYAEASSGKYQGRATGEYQAGLPRPREVRVQATYRF